jgi:predicted metal-dependent HD superfamily phosphohydrolase
MNSLHFIRFLKSCADAGVSASALEEVGLDLLGRYAEAGRHYHNFTHVQKMLSWLDRTGEWSPAMELAVWFHDAVYEPLGRENEAESAAYFERSMGPMLDAGLRADVVRLILATDFRRPRTGMPDEALLIDIDFSILASEWGEYDAYRHAVRREYAMVPEAEFTAGRSAVLRHFLSGSIFSTDFFVPLEPIAQSNLRRELTLLSTEWRSE